MIRNVIFDIGQVLVDFRWRGYMLDLGIPEKTADLLGERTINAPIWGELDLGARPEEDIIADMISIVPGHEEEFRRFLDNPVDVVRPFPKTRERMLKLKEAGYGIYLLSNYPKSMFELHAEKSFNFMDIIDGKIVSSFEKLVKPQPEIYELLLSRYNLKREECVFLDDRVVNVEAARALGISAIHVKTQDEAMEELGELLHVDL